MCEKKYSSFICELFIKIITLEEKTELIKSLDLDYILTETDSPYLAMTKEERNEPANVVKAVKKIAEIQNEDIETVDSITTNNARKVFKI